ncbi:MAG: HAD family phosphatase [Prolixibacteraceae bacterium]|nr:HAD family phosphatase [Prolixibacteraceae bacterium]
MIKAIIFDMDGVLVDSEPFHIEIEKQQFLMNQLSITNEEHHRYMGVATKVMWEQIAERHSLNASVEELTEQNRIESIRFFTEVKEIPVMPGLIDLLEKLQQKKYPMAVASSSFPEIIELILERTGIRKYFHVVVSSQEAGKSKPEPDVFLLAARKLKVMPNDCMVVEDSKNGIKAAQAAGMSCVAYQSHGVDPQSQKEADAVVKSYAQLGMML